MLGKEPERPLMPCGCSSGGEQHDASKGPLPDSFLTGVHEPRQLSPFGHLFRFTGRWCGFTGLYAAFSVCPFCGQAGCPVGVGIAGAVGAFFALCATDWKRLFRYIRDRRHEKGKGGPGTLNVNNHQHGGNHE